MFFQMLFFDLAFSKPSQGITILSFSLSFINVNDSARKQANAKSQKTMPLLPAAVPIHCRWKKSTQGGKKIHRLGLAGLSLTYP